MRILIETSKQAETKTLEDQFDAINDSTAKAQAVMEIVALIQSQRQFLRGVFLKAGHADDPILNQLLDLAASLDR